LVWNVGWLPDIRFQFAVQGFFVRNLRLSVLNRLFSYGLRNLAAERARFRNRRE
jgi:hypothetical protein